MKEFHYVIKDAQGIHARPAGALIKKAGEFSSKITISKDGKEVDAKRIMAVMSLAAKQGNEIILKAEGEDEEQAIAALQTFLEENL